MTAEQIASMNINYDLLPEHLQEGVRRYIEHGIQPGGFLCAVITNDLSDAVLRADVYCLLSLREIVCFFLEAPEPCWGSVEKMEAWIAEQRAQVSA